ncbi:protein of unknown function DUF302 [Thermosinus carboxydivorans Nor1]|uniref:DUF302 domain-containing protein n=1 Tax=Thermosinus carboxydivorans Nor1 TaxID=401526 RepID=A1HNH3_9FIRM|nr:DUF302 domain-containing protein [Thermosinus carboxydivorans]EAX48332.1 protein of unknown function DUF302 [Thermosinus carboxydivorans Nor1]
MFDYTVTSQKSFQEAIDSLKEALISIKFGVLWELDVPGKLQEKGVQYKRNFRILEVCNPQKAKEALEADIRVGYFLPCKIVVYVKDDITQIGTIRPTTMIQMFNNTALHSFAHEVEQELIKAIDMAK